MAQPHHSQRIKEKNRAQVQDSRSPSESRTEAVGAPSPAGFMNMLPDTALPVPLPAAVPAAIPAVMPDTAPVAIPTPVAAPAQVPASNTPVAATATPLAEDLHPFHPGAQVDSRRLTEHVRRSAEVMPVSACICT